MNLAKIGISLLLISFLASCSASYKELNKLDSKKALSFNDYLHLEYKNKAIYEAEEMHDWNSAKLYSEKALKSINNDAIYPEKISHWDLPKNRIKEIKIAHESINAIYDNAKIIDPYHFAKAIVSLDCWSEQQEEIWQIWDINKCKNDFFNSMHIIYDKISERENITNNKLREAEYIKNEVTHIIYFDFDKSNLSDQAIRSLNTFLKKNKNQISEFLIVGHTDTKGSKQYNINLSWERAKVVKKLLIENKIHISKIKILGKGENKLAIITPDNTKHPANRRVEIKKTN